MCRASANQLRVIGDRDRTMSGVDARCVVPRAGVVVPADLRGDRAIAFLAAAQHGVVATWQLAACGVGRSVVRRRIASGWMTRALVGVYATGHVKPTFQARAMAAVLAAGPGAFVSHISAGLLLDILPTAAAAAARSGDVDVTVTGGRNLRSRVGLRRHRTVCLDARDLRWIGAIPVSSAPRTVLDVADGGDHRLVERVLASAYRGRHATEPEVRALLSRSVGRAGLPVVGRVVGAGDVFDRSEAERLLLELLRRAGMAEPRMNVHVGGFEVDGLWDAEHVVVEFDSFTFHGDRIAFRRDRRKSARLQAQGYDVVPVIWEDLKEHPEMVVGVIASVLAVARERIRSGSSA